MVVVGFRTFLCGRRNVDAEMRDKIDRNGKVKGEGNREKDDRVRK